MIMITWEFPRLSALLVCLADQNNPLFATFDSHSMASILSDCSPFIMYESNLTQ